MVRKRNNANKENTAKEKRKKRNAVYFFFLFFEMAFTSAEGSIQGKKRLLILQIKTCKQT